MMNILISVNKRYLDKAETMLHSLRRHHAGDITVYLCNRALSSGDIRKFRNYLTKRLRMRLEILEMPQTAFDQLSEGNDRFPVEVFYRVLAQFFLPKHIERILWLDADMIIRGNIDDFYYQNFEGNLLAACPDAACEDEEIAKIKDHLQLPKAHIYFNSGVLLLNVAALREKTNAREIIHTAQSISACLQYPDQDLLNYLYTGQVKYCAPDQYNCQTIELKKVKQEQIDKSVILHYAGGRKPWLFYYLHDLADAALPYWKEVALQGRWLSIIKMAVLYALWLVYFKTGICHFVRKELLKCK